MASKVEYPHNFINLFAIVTSILFGFFIGFLEHRWGVGLLSGGFMFFLQTWFAHTIAFIVWDGRKPISCNIVASHQDPGGSMPQ